MMNLLESIQDMIRQAENQNQRIEKIRMSVACRDAIAGEITSSLKLQKNRDAVARTAQSPDGCELFGIPVEIDSGSEYRDSIWFTFHPT